MDLLGAHISTAGGISKAPARAAALSTRVMQVMTALPNRWEAKPISDGEVDAFRRECLTHGLTFVASHEAYLPNRATPDATLFQKSMRMFRGEVERCSRLGVDALCLHPGSATDGDRQRGIAQEAAAIAEAIPDAAPELIILLEMTAGGGNLLGATFEEIARYLDALPGGVAGRVGFAMDTCHLWAQGYDLTDLAALLDEAERIIGLDRLGMIHMNGSSGARGSRRDRHTAIEEGTIPLDAFSQIMNEPRLAGVPKILETPKGKDGEAEDRRNLETLRSLVR